MGEFHIGDIVRCVNAFDSVLIVNAKYTIESIGWIDSDKFLRLREFPGAGGFYDWRFVKDCDPQAEINRAQSYQSLFRKWEKRETVPAVDPVLPRPAKKVGA